MEKISKYKAKKLIMEWLQIHEPFWYCDPKVWKEKYPDLPQIHDLKITETEIYFRPFSRKEAFTIRYEIAKEM